MQGKDNLYIIGAGGFGREIETWLHHDEIISNYNFLGYLDDNSGALKDYLSNYKIIGSPFSYNYKKNDYVILGIADPKIKAKIVSSIKGHVNYFTYISRNAIIGKYNIIGEGSIICPGAIVTTNTKIGNFVTINIGSQIGHDVTIGSYSSIMANVDVDGKCNVAENVYIGTGATILPSIKINNNSKIGAGSVVIRNVPASTTVFGNPAIKIEL